MAQKKDSFWYFIFIISSGCLVFFTLFSIYSNIAMKDDYKILFAIDLIRHGDRAPLYKIPGISDYWNDMEKGSLTAKGIEESQILGEKLRYYYTQETKLLPRNYNREDMKVWSTDSQRTKDTARNILKGFYPFQAHEIEIPFYPQDHDPLILIPKEERVRLRDKYIFVNTKENDIKRIRELLESFRSRFSIEDQGDSQILKIGDILSVNKHHNLPLPESISKAEEKEILQLSENLKINRFRAPEVACKNAAPLLREIVSQIDKHSDSTRSPDTLKYIMYVAHDINLASALTLLSYKVDEFPPYNSNIRFELAQKKNNKKLYVKVSYDDTKKNKVIRTSFFQYCPLEKFTDHMSQSLKDTCASF